MKFKLILVMAVFIISTFANESCEIDVVQLGKCPSSRTKIAPKHFPAQVIFPPITSVNDFKKVKRYLDALGEGQRIALDINSSVSKRIQGLEQYKNKVLFTDDRGAPYRDTSLSRGIAAGNSENSAYIRDSVIFGIDQQSGAIVRDSRSSSTLDDFSMCGIPVRSRDAGDQMGEKGANFGGNIMGFPGGGCLVGENMDRDLARGICGEGNPIITLDTYGTTVGHIDELYNIVPNPNRPAPCNFTVLITEQEAYLESLRRNPEDLFFEKDYFGGRFEPGTGQPILVNTTGRQSDKNPHDYICRMLETYSLYKKLKERSVESSGSERGNGVRQTFFRYLDLVISNSYAGAIKLGVEKCGDEPYNAGTYDYSFGRPPATYAEKCEVDEEVERLGLDKILGDKPRCSDIKNKDVLELFSEPLEDIESVIQSIPQEVNGVGILKHHQLASKIGTLKTLIEGNRYIKEVVKSNKQKIKDNLPRECQSQDIFTSVPALFNGVRSISPNPANLTVVGNTAFYPQQFNSKIGDIIEETLSGHGLLSEPENTFYYHTGGGNVHCLTNEIRLCAPAL